MKSLNLPTICFFIVLVTSFSVAQIKTESTNKDDIGQTIIAAQELLKKGDVTGAISVLQTALQSQPQNENIRYWLSKSFIYKEVIKKPSKI